jgi:hypothetical protein
LIGVLTGGQGEVPTADLMAKQARLQGLMVGSRRQQQDYVAALEQSGVRPVLDRSFAKELYVMCDTRRYGSLDGNALAVSNRRRFDGLSLILFCARSGASVCCQERDW